MKAHHRQQQQQQQLMPPPSKPRRCSALAAGVLALVVCSILLPLASLLGLHRPGAGGYGFSEERAAVVVSTEPGSFGARGNRQHLEDGGAMEMKHELLKDVSKKKASGSNGISDEMPPRSTSKNHATRSKAKQLKASFSLVQLNNDTFKSNGKGNHGQETVHEGTPKSCGEHEYGSYCLWSTEHREVMKDDVVKRLKDQLFIARAHYPSIAKIKQHERFTRELKQSIQEHERMLSDTITDADLPPMILAALFFICSLMHKTFMR